MGADIHAIAEVKKPRYADGVERWLQLDEPVFEGWGEGKSGEPFVAIRNYTLFALLADVRNGYGFAGIKTGDAIQPLSQPRGIAPDASYAWREVVEYWDVDMHSHSYFTLAELVSPEFEALYDQRLVRRGVIDEQEYLEIKSAGGKPKDWAGSVRGNGIRTLTPEQYDAGERGERSTYVEWIWEDDLRESTKALHDVIAALKSYADDYFGESMPYTHLRISFGFDN